MKQTAFIILILVFMFTGCNYKLREPVKTPANTNTAEISEKSDSANTNKSIVTSREVETAEGGKLILSGTSESTSYPCNGREVEIEEAATANTLTLTGECRKLTVNGVSNKVFVEKVGEIVVTGVSNKVLYGGGIGGKKPKISKTGASTSVEQKDAAEANKNSAVK